MTENPTRTNIEVPAAPVEPIAGLDESSWASTYSVLTADRILGQMNILLENYELINAIKDPESAYFQILRVPMKNVLNGIILQQALDYQVYVQKLYVDYLLSGEGSKDENSQGADSREELENLRLELVDMGEKFATVQFNHKTLIADSQRYLISQAPTINPALPRDMHDEIKTEIIAYAEKADRMNDELRDFRSQFYDLILKVTSLLNTLSDYRIDAVKTSENRESLHFDPKIGDPETTSVGIGG